MTEAAHASTGRPGSREALIASLARAEEELDLLVIGGGITGAGILREATRAGLKALLVEQRDFAWGTSSRSSKMVHGGLRYLSSGQFGLTREAVRERQRMLREAPGLVDPLPFLMNHYPETFPGPRLFALVLAVYDAIAGRRNHRFWREGIRNYLAPGLGADRLLGVTQFGDAVTDDARLVLRVLQDALAAGARALNYVEAVTLLRDQGRVVGMHLRDALDGGELQLRARCVVNATGAWTDALRAQLGIGATIRPLRGSHLVIPAWRLPVAFAVSFQHPADRRPVYAFPWEGVTVIGTTDLDHAQDMARDACITQQEVDYLLDAVNGVFPSSRLAESDVISCFAGVRPVVGERVAEAGEEAPPPSKEKRDHSVWDDQGLVSVAGGKLTTFRLIAHDVLRAARPYLPAFTLDATQAIFVAPEWTAPRPRPLAVGQWQRLIGRYGEGAAAMDVGGFERVAGTDTLWAELEWALGNEMVVHLEDLLLRRTRLGLLLGDGVYRLLPRIRHSCLRILGWDAARWDAEEASFRELMRRCYSLPAQQGEQA